MDKRTYREDLPLAEIKTWLYKREQINESKLAEQIADIKNRGVIEPIVVRKVKKGYEGIAGYLRFRASQETAKTTIPSIIYESIDDMNATQLLAVENIQRQELSDIDTANILNLFVVKQKLQQKQIAEMLNCSESYVSHYLSLLKDKEPLRKAISEGTVTEKQARMIRALPNENAMQEALEELQKLGSEKRKTDDTAEVTVTETKDVVSSVLGRHTQDQISAEIQSYEQKLREIGEFEKKRDVLQQEIDKLSGELKALKTDNEELNRNIKKIMELESKYYPALEQITSIKSQIADLDKTRPKNPSEYIDKLEKERKTVYERQAKLKAQIDTITEQLKALREQHKKEQESASALTQQMNQMKATETQIAQAQKNLISAQNTVNSYQTSHKTAIDNFENLKAKVEAEDRTLLDKRKAIADKIANISHEKMQLNGKIANKKNYQDAITVLQKKLDSKKHN